MSAKQSISGIKNQQDELSTTLDKLHEQKKSIDKRQKRLTILKGQVEQKAGQGIGSLWPKKAERRKVESPILSAAQETSANKQKTAGQRTVFRPILRPDRKTPASAQQPVSFSVLTPSLRAPELIEFKPPPPDATLRQQLDDFAQVLGYAPGDHLYVRALLPKNLSDEMAVSHRLKFEIEENGKKRLIPNTRRGYLTVGSWEFTHIRKAKDPTIHADGLSKLAELNKEGRGIYFVVNPGGEKNGDISSARSVFWETDDKSKSEQIEQAQTSRLPLGAVVETQKSIHCYSPLAAPLTDLDEWKKLQERVIQRMESDPAIRNSSRLMRLPGFDHVRVEGTGADERLIFTPVSLRHIDPSAKGSTEEIAAKLPQWDEDLWSKQNQKGEAMDDRMGEAALPTLAADNPWDIRNFARYLNGDHYSQNGWLKVQCPHHGGEGHSGDSLGINEATGQYTCYGGCDTKDVYGAAWNLAKERGWTPPEQQVEAPKQAVTDVSKPPLMPKPVLIDKPVRIREKVRSKGIEL